MLACHIYGHEGYKIAVEIQKSPKGLAVALERDPSKKPKQSPKPNPAQITAETG